MQRSSCERLPSQRKSSMNGGIQGEKHAGDLTDTGIFHLRMEQSHNIHQNSLRRPECWHICLLQHRVRSTCFQYSSPFPHVEAAEIVVRRQMRQGCYRMPVLHDPSWYLRSRADAVEVQSKLGPNCQAVRIPAGRARITAPSLGPWAGMQMVPSHSVGR